MVNGKKYPVKRSPEKKHFGKNLDNQ